jgi:hypothetical protein
MPNITLSVGGSYTYKGKRFENGVSTPVTPADAAYLLNLNPPRFTDAGAPPIVAAKPVNTDRKVVKLSDSIKEDAEVKKTKDEKSKELAEKQKAFTLLVEEVKSNLPEFKDVKEVRQYAKDEFGLQLAQFKLPALIDELAHAIAEMEQAPKEPKAKTKKEVNKKTAVKV